MATSFVYPTVTQAIECGTSAVSILRSGNILAQKSQLALDACCVGSFGSMMAFGDPNGPFAGTADQEEVAAQKCVEVAEALHAARPDLVTAAMVNEVKSTGFQASADGTRKVDWAKWAKFFLTVVLPLIMDQI